MYNYRFCNICKKLEKIVEFQRDNPVLDCGHVKHPTNLEIDECRDELLSKLESGSVLLGIPFQELKQSVLESICEEYI